MAFLRINGIDLHYETHGSGPALVFAHGRGGNHLSWWQQVPHFASRYRCIVFDHRGFGQSGDAPSRTGRHAYVDDLRALLDHLGVERASLVAQSMGGWTCLGFALAHPERVDALVLADTTGGISDPEVLAYFSRRAAAPSDLLARVIGSEFREREPAKTFLYTAISALNPPGASAYPSILTAGDGPLRPALSALRVPTLFLVGAGDVLTPPEAVELAAKTIPGARVTIVPGAGHSVYFEKPEAFNRVVHHFLTQAAR